MATRAASDSALLVLDAFPSLLRTCMLLAFHLSLRDRFLQSRIWFVWVFP